MIFWKKTFDFLKNTFWCDFRFSIFFVSIFRKFFVNIFCFDIFFILFFDIKQLFIFVRIFFNVQIYVSTTQEKCLARPWCLLGDAARPNPRLYTFQSSTETTLTWLVSWDLAVDLLQKWEVTLLSFELWGALKKIDRFAHRKILGNVNWDHKPSINAIYGPKRRPPHLGPGDTSSSRDLDHLDPHFCRGQQLHCLFATCQLIFPSLFVGTCLRECTFSIWHRPKLLWTSQNPIEFKQEIMRTVIIIM